MDVGYRDPTLERRAWMREHQQGRRNLSREEMRAMIQQRIAESKSERQVGEESDIPKSTVHELKREAQDEAICPDSGSAPQDQAPATDPRPKLDGLTPAEFRVVDSRGDRSPDSKTYTSGQGRGRRFRHVQPLFSSCQ